MSLAIWDTTEGGARVSAFAASPPGWQSSTPARASWAWIASHIWARLRMSPSSHSLDATHGITSPPGLIVQTSVNTAPQPPSAFIPRNAAWKPGRSDPAPLQCGTCQNRFFRVLGPTWTGSKRMSYLASRAMTGLQGPGWHTGAARDLGARIPGRAQQMPVFIHMDSQSSRNPAADSPAGRPCAARPTAKRQAGLLTKLSIWIVSALSVVHPYATHGPIWRADRRYAGGRPRSITAALLPEGERRVRHEAVPGCPAERAVHAPDRATALRRLPGRHHRRLRAPRRAGHRVRLPAGRHRGHPRRRRPDQATGRRRLRPPGRLHRHLRGQGRRHQAVLRPAMTAMTTTQQAPATAATVLREFEATLVVTAVSDAAEGVKTITLANPDGTALPAWSPGAHIDVVLGDDLTRQYSLCGDASDDTTWRIGVLATPDSRGGSVRVHELKTGDTVRVRGPRNHFPLVGAASYQF